LTYGVAACTSQMPDYCGVIYRLIAISDLVSP